MKTPTSFSKIISINQIRRTASLMIIIAIIPFLMSYAQSGWHRQTSGTTQNLLSLDFCEFSSGFVVGDSNIILHTTDSGRTWTMQANSPSLCLKDISMVNPDTSFAIGNSYIDAFPATIRTYDGGTTWTLIRVDTMTSATRIRMYNATDGFMSGNTIHTMSRVLTTYWGWEYAQASLFDYRHEADGHDDPGFPNDMAFADSYTGFIAAGILDGDGAIARTTDGAYSWPTVYWVDDHSLYGVDCPSIDMVYVVGDFGMIYRSTDTGETWENQRSNTGDALCGVSFFDNMTGLAVGQNGTIVATTNGGENWTLQESGTTVTLRRVKMLSPGIAYAVGDSGTVLYTRRGGWPPAGCDYIVGDINDDGRANGLDVTYGVAYFKGANQPLVDCVPPCTWVTDPFFAAGDVNGDCRFNGVDITYYVAYLKQVQPALRWCEDCPPIQ
ncbi:MAG: hypothetical protein A2W25_08150 [candidate division Zixibacteria bacterium RBG_16_53_22]|nr:MAG: hypothetical protein A2W25_08150 [candidate division Zixibacteria bacterium RBG_16_53_22]